MSDQTTTTSSSLLKSQPGKHIKNNTQLRLLNQLATRLQGLVDSESFYSELVDLVQTHFNYYSLIVASVDHSGREEGDAPTYTIRAQAGAYRNHLQLGHTFHRLEGICGEVIRTRQSYLANDVTQDSHYTDLSLPIDTQSELCIPVIKDGEVIALIDVESDQKNAFDEDDVITLESIAAQVAVAVSNQKLFSEARDFNRKLQTAVEEKTLELRRAHERILDQQRLLQKENKALKTLVNYDKKGSDLIGQSPAILNILTMVDKIAPTTASVLIQGESGTGKELIARRLHFQSERAPKPYVTVNCGALQESLLESELFGHEKGSFTGAVSQKLGLVETAENGTLFLDEIGEMSLGIQAKLLRFLQEGEFYRIGGKKPIKVDVRVVSATNRDLEQEVKEGRFREDLFYRLNTITLRMPPLRKRPEDIALLLDYFLKNSRFGGAAQQIRRIDPRVIEVFQNYDWPGNIRELQNTIERMKILAENNEIKIEDVPFTIRMPKTLKSKGESTEFMVDLPLEEVEKNHILRVLAYHHGNKTKTAHCLGITIKTLYNKLHRYGYIPNAEGQTPAAVGSTNNNEGNT